MQYLIYPIFLILYFEILGRWILYKFNRNIFEFSFIIGFVGLMGIMFITMWPITVFNQSFYLLLFTFIFINLVLVFNIIKDYKKINYKINIKLWLILLVLVLFQCYMFSQRSLGETHGFDTLYYINLIDFNIGNSELNSLHTHFGTYPNYDIRWFTYIYQSYYYFVSLIIYIFRVIFSVVDVSFETLPAYVWGMQILLNFIFVATGIICINYYKFNKYLKVALGLILILFLGNLYYNNALGFIGNNFRMSIHAISTIILLDYLKDYKQEDFWLFILMQFGLCAVASTGTFSLIFILFGMFFVLYNKEKDLLKKYAIIMYLPLTTILVTKVQVQLWVFIFVFIICLIVYYLNDIILKLYQNNIIRYGTIFIAFISLYIGSFIMTKDIINLEMFFNNYSEIADMSFDYFMFNDIVHIIFNIFILSILFYYIIKNRSSKLSIIFIILILTFFNPLGSFFMNQINWVYYRAYDIIINQFTIVIFILYMYMNIRYKKVLVVTCLTIGIVITSIQVPSYSHSSFKVDKDLDVIHKINKQELEVIRNIQTMVKEENIINPKIITSTFYMPTYIDNSIYLFGKEKRYNSFYKDESAYPLYLIFFPVDYIYDNFRPSDIPDYKNTIKYLNETTYDILVVEHGLYYTDTIKNESWPITTLIEEDGTYQKTKYSTSKYAVYDLRK